MRIMSGMVIVGAIAVTGAWAQGRPGRPGHRKPQCDEAVEARPRRQRHPHPARRSACLRGFDRRQRRRYHRPQDAHRGGPTQDQLRSRRDGLARHETVRKPGNAAPNAGGISRQSLPEKTPVGVEPTSTGLQPAACPSGSSAEFMLRRFSISALDPGRLPRPHGHLRTSNAGDRTRESQRA